MALLCVLGRIYNGNGADSYQVEIQGQFDQWLQERVANLMPPIISDYVPWLKFFSETVQGWRARIQAFERKEMALFVKMIDLDERRERAAERRDDESYVPDFVDVMLGAPLDDGNVLEDEFIIKQVLVRITPPFPLALPPPYFSIKCIYQLQFS